MQHRVSLTGRIVDVVKGEIYPGEVVIESGRVADIVPGGEDNGPYILPGLIDSHVHIESSMLLPSEFARMAVIHGTTATVSDPHEIANVLGVDGVYFMIRNGKKVPFRFNFGAPSCVPATPFETSGANIGPEGVRELLAEEDIRYLSEMMNFPGVLNQDPEVMEKLKAASELGKPVDGHAPGLMGDDAQKYADAGITTDHECFDIGEARDKIKAGMKILIREGSAARNFDTLIPLIEESPEAVMFCSDDKHPDDLLLGHINLLVKRALEAGYDLFSVLRAASLNPVNHYDLDSGLLQPGDRADLILVDDLKKFEVIATYVEGELVAERGRTLIESVSEEAPNAFKARMPEASDLHVPAKEGRIKVISALDGQLITQREDIEPKVKDGLVVADPERDILKMMVLNRYQEATPAIDFVKNFGLKKGAIASTVAHDSHNIICVGTNDEDMLEAVRMLIETKGGIVAVDGKESSLLPLPVGGIMSEKNAWDVAEDYQEIDAMAKSFGSRLRAPFMTLSFMALLVIPALKLSDKGLFDGSSFSFTEIFEPL